MTANEILTFIREGVRDKKTLAIRVVDEIVTSSYIETGEADYNVYYTKYLPISSNSDDDVKFLGGRWNYEVEDTGDDGTRWVQWVSESGAFVLDSGATQVGASDTVKVSYTWDQPQSYTYRDSEIRQWMKDATLWTNKATCNETSFSVTGSVDDSTFGIDPAPSAYVGQLIGLKAQYEMRRARAAESDTRAIQVKQGDIMIDTTKGGRDRLASLQDLKGEIDRMVANIIIGEVEGIRIDVYSTKDNSIYDQGYYQESNAGAEKDIMEG